jgi:3-hydroxyacyl-[acyl-carrier-protein] dehydratase
MSERRAPPVYDAVAILKHLPHRFPFLLVDRVDELVKPKDGTRVGCRIRATKCVTFNEPYFLAQVAALASVDPNGPAMDVAIAGINEARFRRPVVPGDVLTLTAEVLKDRAGLLIIKCEASTEGEIVCQAEIIAKMFPMETRLT